MTRSDGCRAKHRGAPRGQPEAANLDEPLLMSSSQGAALVTARIMALISRLVWLSGAMVNPLMNAP